MYGLVMWFAKAALVFQLLHIFTPNFRGPFFWSLHALLWINLLFYTGGAFAVLFQCIPREKIWNPAVTGTCIDVEIYFIATSVVNIVSDVSLLLLPITVIWNLKMDLKKKFSVSVVFATGLLWVSLLRKLVSANVVKRMHFQRCSPCIHVQII